MKAIFLLFLVLFSNHAICCSCAGSNQSIQEIYESVDGIYYTNVNAVAIKEMRNKYDAVLDVELKVYKVYKGPDIDVINALANGSVPVVQDDGQLMSSMSSCDIPITFGDEYFILIRNDEVVFLSYCSKNIMNKNKVIALKKLIE